MRGLKLYVFFSLAAGVSLGPASGESLGDVLAAVYSSNPTIIAERSNLDATRELPRQARAVTLPQISVDGAAGRINTDQVTTVGLFDGEDGTERDFELDTKTLSITGEQPIFTGFRNHNAIRQAQARLSAGEARLAAVEQQILLEAATAYFDVVRDLEIYKANASNVEVLLKQRNDDNRRFELGEITRTDVMQSEARLAGARAQVSSAKTGLAVSRASYREIVGAAPGGLEPNPALPDLPETLEDAIAFAQSNAPAVTVARQEEEASRRQIGVARSSYLPSVSIVASYGLSDEPSSFIVEEEELFYGVRARIPIFQGGLPRSRVREAKALNKRDQFRIDAVERNVEARVTGVWEELFEARVRIESARAQEEANRAALEGVRREAQLGARTTLDVLNAEQELLNSTMGLAAARRDEQVAAYSLLAAIGALSPEAAERVSDAAVNGLQSDPIAMLILKVTDERYADVREAAVEPR